MPLKEDSEDRIKAFLGPDELIGLVPGLGIVANPFYGQNYQSSGSSLRIEILGPALSPAKTAKQKRFLEGVKSGAIHRKGITPKDAAKALGDGEKNDSPKKKKKG